MEREARMKSHSPILREITIQARRQGRTFASIAEELRLPVSTIKSWLYRRHATTTTPDKSALHATTPPPSESAKTGQWMQSLHHDSAHFLINGQAACAKAANGVHQLPGVVWFPHDGCVRKCMRCMRHQ
jgi:hypothetical protein